MRILQLWRACLVLLVACTTRSTASNPDSEEKINPQLGDPEELTPERGNGSNNPVGLDDSELSQMQPDASENEFSDGACSLNAGTCEPSGPSLTEAEVPAPPPLPPALPPAPAPPPIQAPAPSPFIRAPAPPPVRELADTYASADTWQSYAFNDRQAWLSIGQTTESDAERQMRLAMADEVKMEAQHFAEVLEHQQQSIHHDAWAYYEGDLMRLKHRRLVGLRSSLIVMCFSPLFAWESASGGGCRAAFVAENWGVGSGDSQLDGKNVLPPLPWGQSSAFLEQASVGNHLELARMGDDRFLVCFESSLSMQVFCRLGLVQNDSVITYGALLEDSRARLVSVSSSGKGSEFAVCSQSFSESNAISCRWGQVSGEGVATELQWATRTPMSFAFDGR